MFEMMMMLFSFIFLNEENIKKMYFAKFLFMIGNSSIIILTTLLWIPRIPALGGIVAVDLITRPFFYILFDPI